MIVSVIKNKHTYTFCQTIKIFLKKQFLMFLENIMLLLRIVSERNAIKRVQGYLLIRSDHQNIRYAKIAQYFARNRFSIRNTPPVCAFWLTCVFEVVPGYIETWTSLKTVVSINGGFTLIQGNAEDYLQII